MTNFLSTAAAALIVVLFGAAVVSMANGSLRVAGFCFLSASVVIYFRATRLVG
jgi:uncharacterized protein YjeT (DUF2065 family)